jgi:putative SOS response-associated peptidase YedK
MCGRFTLYIDSKKLNSVFHLADNVFDYVPRYNIAPGQELPVITQGAGGRELSYMKWGLVPHWAKDPRIGYKLINARAETVDCKPAFRASFRHNRCLVPADGFYEWMKINGKQPVYVSLPGCPVFAFAGLWSCWNKPEGGVLHSCSIITTDASECLRDIHDRMPVIFDREQQYQAWLEQSDAAVLKSLLHPYPGELVIHRVSTSVNYSSAEDPRLIEKIDVM